MRTIYIECGTTNRNPVNSGIQRVVRNIVREAQYISANMGVMCIPVEYVHERFQVLEEKNHNHSTTSRQTNFLFSIIIRLDQFAQQSYFSSTYYRFRHIIKSVVRKKISIKKKNTPSEPIFDNTEEQSNSPSKRYASSPILLLLDSSWIPGMWSEVEKFRAAGGHVTAVLYDLIPFSHPDTVAEATRIAHTTWWSKAPLHVDSVICISQSVREEFLAWQETQKLPRKLAPERVGYFYLGADIAKNDPVLVLITDSIPFYLVVGSLEPRKNHALVLDAFEQLWQRGHEIRLVIVGAFGWKSERLLERIYAHPELNKRLYLIRDASDRDLATLYSKTAGVIIPSIAEGFGLPIVEAFQHGTSVICSDIPVFREVAGVDAVYFDPYDSNSLVKVLSSSSIPGDDQYIVKNSAKKCWLSWQESAESLLSCVNTMATGDSKK